MQPESTYHVLVPALYAEYREEYLEYDGEFEDWILDQKEDRSLPEGKKKLFAKLKLRLRLFEGNVDNDSLNFVLNDDSRESLEELISTLQASDIVTVTGESIIGMRRNELIANGPEFFVKNYKFPSLTLDVKYFENVKDVLKQYLKTLSIRVVGRLAQDIINVTDHKSLVRLFQRLRHRTGLFIGKKMKSIKVRVYGDFKSKKDPRDHEGGEMLEALKYVIQDSTTSQENFNTQLLRNLNKSVCDQVDPWLRRFSKSTKEEQNKILISQTSHVDSIGQSISTLMKKNILLINDNKDGDG